MKLTMFVSNAASTSGRPTEAQNLLRLQIPPKSDQIDDENADVFPDATKKAASVDIQGLSDATMADFKGGQRVTVTIEIAK